jgi:hypothetical protein
MACAVVTLGAVPTAAAAPPAPELELTPSAGQWQTAVILTARMTVFDGAGPAVVPGQTVKFYKLPGALAVDVSTGELVGEAVTGPRGGASVAYNMEVLGADAPEPGEELFFAAVYEGSPAILLGAQSPTMGHAVRKRNTRTTLSLQAGGLVLDGALALSRQPILHKVYSGGVYEVLRWERPIANAVIRVFWVSAFPRVIGFFDTARTNPAGKVRFSKAIPERAKFIDAQYRETPMFYGSGAGQPL